MENNVRFYLGIDIGLKGGLCILDTITGFRELYDMPVVENVLDERHLLKLVKEQKIRGSIHIVIEALTTLHLASKTTNWVLGEQSGAIRMMAAALNVPLTAVPPKTWQREMFMGIPPLRKKTGEADTKGMAYIAACRLFPEAQIKKTKDGLTDAMLLAEWGRRNIK